MHKERLFSGIENDKLECEECGSLSFDDTNAGYACRECGLVIEKEKFDYSSTPNYDISTLKNSFGNKKEVFLHPRSRRLKKLDSMPSNNEERVYKQAEIEAKRILSDLDLPDSFSSMICYKFRKIFKSGRINRGNRGAKTLIPAIIFYCLKSWNFTVNISEILSVSNLKKEKFNAVLGAIQEFFPKYKLRKRKDYILMKISHIREACDLGMEFYHDAKAIMERFWDNFKHSKDDVIAGVIASMTALSFYRNKVKVSDICKVVHIAQSTIQYQVKKKIFERYKIRGFTSLVKSSGLLKRVVSKALKLDKDSNNKSIQTHNPLLISTSESLVCCTV